MARPYGEVNACHAQSLDEMRGNAPGPDALGLQMNKPKHTARIENIFFLSRIGSTLRWATQDIAREDLPPDIKRLLGRLDRLEARTAIKDNGAKSRNGESGN
jgi:hypothetical protein